MARKTKLLVFFLCLTSLGELIAQNQIAFNVAYRLLKDNSIEITYDLPKGEVYSISIIVLSENDGEIKPTTVSGDIGHRIKGGMNKKATWKIMLDYPQGIAVRDIYVRANVNTSKNFRTPLRINTGFIISMGTGLPVINNKPETSYLKEDSAKIMFTLSAGLSLRFSIFESGIFYRLRGFSNFYQYEGVLENSGNDVLRTEVYNHRFSGIEIPFAINIKLGQNARLQPGAFFMYRWAGNTHHFIADKETLSNGQTKNSASNHKYVMGKSDSPFDLNSTNYGLTLGIFVLPLDYEFGLKTSYALNNWRKKDPLPEWHPGKTDNWQDLSIELLLRYNF